MSDGWFETVAEAQRRARRRLPSSVYGALVIPPGFTRTLGVSDQGTRAAGQHRLPVR